MLRKKKTPPTFKVGQWVRLSPQGASEKLFLPLFGRVFRIKRMEYDAGYEKNPSPWMIHPEMDGDMPGQLWEEHIQLDVFMNSAHDAVARRPRAQKKAHTAEV